MKLPLFILAMLCLSINSNAQFRVGLTTSYTMTTASENSLELSNLTGKKELLELNYVSSSSNLAYGISTFNDLGLIWIKADVNYQKVKHHFTAESFLSDLRRSTGAEPYSQSKQTIQLPISSGIQFNNFLVGAGPILSYNFNSQSNNNYESISENTNNLSTGFLFSLGYKIKNRIHINLLREYHFSDVSNDQSYQGTPIEMKTSPHKVSLSISSYF